MENWTSSGTTQIPDEGIKKHFKSYEPCDALIELIWNGIDANAKNITITINENEFGSVDSAYVLDNGDGIDFINIDENFGKFNDSAKKEDFSQHGSHGRGRLAFHCICHDATWYTKRSDGKQACIHVQSEKLKNWNGKGLDDKNQHALLKNYSSGSCVELKNFHKNLPDIDTIRQVFAEEFGWRLALDKTKVISVNGEEIKIPDHEIYTATPTIKSIEYEVSIIRWKKKPTSEKSYIYLLNPSGALIFRTLSGFNYKNEFYVSVLINSELANNFCKSGGDLENGVKYTENSQEWVSLRNWLSDHVANLYKEFLIRNADAKIDEYERQNTFPSYKELKPIDAAWRLNNTKNIVRALYMAEPSLVNKLTVKQKRVFFAILDRISVSSENDCLYDVLMNILELDGESLNIFASQIKKSKLENIVRTIEILQRRQEVIHMMKYIMEERYRKVLETPDLQEIIEANTWLFGEQFETIGAEEDSIKQLAKKARESIPGINSIQNSDFEENDETAETAEIDGILKQPDLLLCRKKITFDEVGNKIIKFTIIEIKRPGIALRKKHLTQLEGYAETMMKMQEFSGAQNRFDFILVGRKISNDDIFIKSRREDMLGKGTFGFVGKLGQARLYVLDWATLLANFEISNNYLLDKLKMERESYSNISTKDIVSNLQSNVA